MMVPLMIWSARTVMLSQACRADTSIPVPRAARSPIRIAGVAPKAHLGSSGNACSTSDATYQPAKAESSIMPSMPMLTTPVRSFMKPQKAPSASGAARARMMVPLSVSTLMR